MVKFISFDFSRTSSHLEEYMMNQSQYLLHRDEQRFLILNVGEIQRGCDRPGGLLGQWGGPRVEETG